MSIPSIDLNTLSTEQVHSLTEVELSDLDSKYQELKAKVTTEGYEMTLDDQQIS